MCAVLVPQTVYSALLAFLVVLACFSIDAIATELQDPFGNDDNDLPLREIMRKFEYEVESILVLNGVYHGDVKGFRTILTQDDKETGVDLQSSVASDNILGYQPRSNGPTALYPGECVQQKAENLGVTEGIATPRPVGVGVVSGNSIVSPAEVALDTLPSMGTVHSINESASTMPPPKRQEEEDEEEDEEETETTSTSEETSEETSEQSEGEEVQLGNKSKTTAG